MDKVLVSRQLPKPQYVKKNVNAFLRSDAANRWKIHDLSIRAGVHTVNDVLELEDEDTIGPEGDQRVWPPNAASPATPATDPAGAPAK